MSPHILCIMSHYTDPALSLRRLEISRATLLPSLAAQTRKPTLHIVVSADDVHLQESTGRHDDVIAWRERICSPPEKNKKTD